MVPVPEDKREFVRVPFKTEVEVEAGGLLIRSTEGINLSMKGIHLSTDGTPPDAGSPCSVRIILRGTEEGVEIQANGVVVRADGGNLSVEFKKLDYDGYHHLRQLILNNADDPERAEREFDAHWGIRKPHP